VAANPSTFTLEAQPEVFASDASTSVAIHRAVAAGRARRLARGLYTKNVDEPLEAVARRNWTAIAAHYAPGSVVVDRSAFEAKPSDDGSLFLDGGPSLPRARTYEVPGLRITVRPGPGPADGDMPHLDSLFYAGRPRAWLENMRPSRARAGVARTLSGAEIERELNRLVSIRGWDALNRLRDEARELAPKIGAADELQAFDDLVGALQGTRNAPLATTQARAARRGSAYDTKRIELFQALQAALAVEHLPVRAEQTRSFPALSFIEAYFSNYIEGTEFELREAEEIVFERAIPEARVEDAHDVLGTFDLVNDADRRRQVPGDPDELLDLLRSQHAAMLERRPQARPGQFKTRQNQAGGTRFVHPDVVEGTLREGLRYRDVLPPGLARAIFMMFLVSEVHPFTDGNGRVARVLMNAELSSQAQQRIVIPLVFRDNYLQGLRALTRNGEPGPFIRVLDYAQRYASLVPWQDLRDAERVLAETNAFVTPEDADETGARLRLPLSL
jgi:Fic/DOC family